MAGCCLGADTLQDDAGAAVQWARALGQGRPAVGRPLLRRRGTLPALVRLWLRGAGARLTLPPQWADKGGSLGDWLG